MKLWNYIKEKMLEHPNKSIRTNNTGMTFEEICIFAEEFSKKLNFPYYGIACGSEMSAAIALLACLAGGKTAIPLPTRYGMEVYRKIVKKAEPPGIITDVNGELEVIVSDYYDNGNKALECSPAVVLFTSGSTGEPKGVMLSEDNIIANIKSISSYFTLDDSDTILITRPIYHSSVLTGELLLSICQGANIVFRSEAFSPREIIRIFKDYEITVFGSTPTLMSTLARFVKDSSDFKIRLLSMSGECVTKGCALNVRKAFPDAEIYCGYGLSEASPRVAYLPSNLFDIHPTSAGIPVKDVLIKVVDTVGNTVETNCIGELLVKGPNVMIGYISDKEKTDMTIKDGWLYTGDLACIDENGLLHIKGRKDDMIIRAGMNIYPSEIENALSSDGRVEYVTVYGYHDGTTQQIGLKIGGNFESVESVSDLCRSRLPSYQMPTKIEVVDSANYNSPSGKKKRC